MVRHWWRQVLRRWRMKRAIAFNAHIHAHLQTKNACAHDLLGRYGHEVILLLRLSKTRATLMNDWQEALDADELLFHIDHPRAYGTRP